MRFVSNRSMAAMPCLAWLVAALLGLGALGGVPARAQVSLPPLDLAIEAASGEVRIDWAEVPSTDGRSVTNVQFISLGDSASTVELLGSYALLCDYRLRITKVPQDAFFGVHVQIVYAIVENTTGVGAAVRSDTLHVFQPDVVYPFATDIAGNLSMRFSTNVNQPINSLGVVDSLGTIAVTVSGLNTSSSMSTSYFCTALNSVATLADGLMVEVTGPVVVPVVPPLPIATRIDTITVTAADVPMPVQNGMFLSFAEGSVSVPPDSPEPPDSLFWTARYLFEPAALITADLESFEGYHVWRSDLPDVNDFTLLGEIQHCESRFDFVLVNEDELIEVDIELFYDSGARTFTLFDRDIHNDFPYRYAVSTFDRGFLGNEEGLTFEGELAQTAKIYPAAQTRNRNFSAYVVPNPYRQSAAWQEGGRKVVFSNLPDECTIRIYTVALDFVQELRHAPDEPRSTSKTSREWDLRTQAGRTIAAGIYLFYIDGTNQFQVPNEMGGAIMRSETFQQVGKFMIAR